ncbi:MAG TPA: energy transducer TonB [Candidatus Dormibacteraeota bacterium]|nr:energy transducer TonB [Candidatus Dormibacteraeota bacterium]
MPLDAFKRIICASCAVASLLVSAQGSLAAQSPTPNADANIPDLALRLIEPLQKSGAKKVIVLDLTAPNGIHPAGPWLAVRLSEALQSKLPNLQFVKTTSSTQPGSTDAKADSQESNEIIPADTIVSGSFGRLDQRLGLTLTVKSVDGHFLLPYTIRSSIPIPQELLSPPYLPLPKAKDPPQAQDAIVTFPSCLSCPPPPYSEEARRAKFEGIVIIVVHISQEGKVTQADLQKGPGYGLDAIALDTVRHWRFNPARGSDGKAVPIVVPIQVSFRLAGGTR